MWSWPFVWWPLAQWPPTWNATLTHIPGGCHFEIWERLRLVYSNYPALCVLCWVLCIGSRGLDALRQPPGQSIWGNLKGQIWTTLDEKTRGCGALLRLQIDSGCQLLNIICVLLANITTTKRGANFICRTSILDNRVEHLYLPFRWKMERYANPRFMLWKTIYLPWCFVELVLAARSLQSSVSTAIGVMHDHSYFDLWCLWYFRWRHTCLA